MFSRMQVDLRPNWESRIKKTGVDETHWKEGEVVAIVSPPASLGHAVHNFSKEITSRMNDLLSQSYEDLLSVTPEYPWLDKEAVSNAICSSWAHQDISLPIRLDVAVLKYGGFKLIGAKGDYLEGMVAAAAVSKAWYSHHYEGDPAVFEINTLQEHLTRILQPLGKNSSPPAVKDVTVLSSESLCAKYIADSLGSNSGLDLSEVGVSSLSSVDKIKDHGVLGSAVIKVDSWDSILRDEKIGPLWHKSFMSPRSFVMQPAWVLALDMMMDLRDPLLEDSDVDFVLNVWLEPENPGPVPLIVSTQYSENYSFEKSMITPVVLDSGQFPDERPKASEYSK